MFAETTYMIDLMRTVELKAIVGDYLGDSEVCTIIQRARLGSAQLLETRSAIPIWAAEPSSMC